MRKELALSIVALVFSSAALALTIGALVTADALGTDISKYDLSSPEATLRSINLMIHNRDLKAGIQLTEMVVRRDGSVNWYLDNSTVKVLKSVEVANSTKPSLDGLIVSFVKVTSAGVDKYEVVYFRKDTSGNFLLGESFYVYEGNEKDKALTDAIKKFKDTGAL